MTYLSATALARLGWLLPESSLISFAMSPMLNRKEGERVSGATGLHETFKEGGGLEKGGGRGGEEGRRGGGVMEG